MAVAHIGKIEVFNDTEETFENYIERLEQFFVVNDFEDGKRASAFLTVVGPKTYGLLKNLVAPVNPKDRTFADNVETLKGHFEPKPLIIFERYKFHSRNQREGETVASYIVELKSLAKTCDFRTFLDEALRDRLVCGMLKTSTQKRLLSEADLTFTKACDISLAVEKADKNISEIGQKTLQTQVNKVQQSYFKNQDRRSFQPDRKKFNQQYKKKTDSTMSTSCFRCGGQHYADRCRFKTAKCYSCQKLGHLAKKCRTNDDQPMPTRYVGSFEPSQDEQLTMFSIENVNRSCLGPKVSVVLGDTPIEMEVDTGAAVSIISKASYQRVLKTFPVRKSALTLKTYSGEIIPVIGEVVVPVRYGDQSCRLPLVVADGNGPALLGRNWLSSIKLDWSNIFKVNIENSQVNELLKEYPNLFNKDIGTIKGFKADIVLSKEAPPIFKKARPVPYALKEVVERELVRLEQQGIVSKVDRSRWAAPLVIVPKSDSSIRLCADFKVTVNQFLTEHQYPLPNVDDLFATLAGGKKFTKLDLSQAYQQLELSERSKEYLTVNTSLGLYRYHRLPFGVASAPSIFQSVMDQILCGIKNVVCRIDDILITAPDDETHLKTLDEVFQRLNNHNIHLRLDKCRFMEDNVVYMGHMVNSEGLHPTQEKIEAIRKAPSPTSVTELKSFLGLLNYYGSFVPNLSSLLHPLHELLQKNYQWCWSRDCEKVFQKCKELLSSGDLLVHYDVNKPIKLACDASLGAVISHVMSDGTERPIAFASRTLAPSEKNYAQIEKEALSLIFGVKKFHKYLYGKKFILETDHKPLTTILGSKTDVPTLAAARLQRWALILASFQYEIQYRQSTDHSNADAMSRLPLQSNTVSEEMKIFHFTYLNELPITAMDISEATRKDPLMSRVWTYIMNGWLNYNTDQTLEQFYVRRNELSAEQGCILWGLRVVVPNKFRNRLLAELHEQHPGICRMKSLARCYLWWPGLDQDVEQMVGSCKVCQSVRKLPAKAPLIPWRWPTRVWERIHVDFAEKDQQSFLVLIDSHSKWIEVVHMGNIHKQTTTSGKTIDVLRTIFASYGLPERIVSDNGPQFISVEFQQFLKWNGIKHTLVPVYHPASNGAAERSVRILKDSLLKQVLDKQTNLTMAHRLADFLFRYRSTPHTVTGVSPAELFLKRQLRTRLSLLKPDPAKFMQNKQQQQKIQRDKSEKERSFEENQVVKLRNFRGGKEKWITGRIIKVKGPRTYLVRAGGKVRYVHVEHIIKYDDKDSCRPGNEELLPQSYILENNGEPFQLEDDNPLEQLLFGSRVPLNPEVAVHGQLAVPDVERRYPDRPRRPPEKLNL